MNARIGRIGLLVFLALAALAFAAPLYVMLATSLKPLEEIRAGGLFALPQQPDLAAWRLAWQGDCADAACGLRAGLLNSVAITLPATVLPVLLGALNGYALSFWRVRGANLLFALLMAGAFVPLQVMVYPLVHALALIGWFGSLPGIVLVHTIFSMPMLTLLFRNYYLAVPRELFHAARIDGGGFLRIFVQLMLPLSLPMLAVAAILQATGVWNDYLLGLVFAGPDHQPMTVQLNNLVNTTTGQRLHNVNMAATVITALGPLVLYVCAGRWFVRGITAGAVKG
ncbi:carbohydrate ABC transporter permease [Massilia sp. TS11]|uniref:carbohydrate ABC transporter permease n=1 Tax=Massilia sp. TS11 TaxID=2908003 RepID=UPI001ED9FB58|nr:carbohydrate ABC transporter permease [Massilia sp. TS11]MCG2586760.1 carbohydrate ABC transporter permease [Massilia sp. TS11]